MRLKKRTSLYERSEVCPGQPPKSLYFSSAIVFCIWIFALFIYTLEYRRGVKVGDDTVLCYVTAVSHCDILQWNLGIRDTHGTVKNCPEFCGGLISQVYFYVLNMPRDWSRCPLFPGCPYFSGGLKNMFPCI